MMKRLCFGLWLAMIYAIPSFGQARLGFSTGFSIDINNGSRFQNIPLSVQWLPAKKGNGSFLLKADVGIPLTRRESDSAYTLSAGLPSAIAVEKRLKSHLLTLGVGYRFRVAAKTNGNHYFIDVLPLGLSSQQFKPAYVNFDKTAYDILNPDVELNRTGFVFGCGLGYQQSNFVAQVHVQTPPTASKGRYQLSHKLNAPLQLSVGYLLPLRKSRK